MFNMKKNITLIMLSIALFTGFNSLLFAEKNKENSMSYVGKWVFHSIMSMDESGRTTFLNAEEYLNTLPDFIDKNNTAAVAEERRERKTRINSVLEICEDGMIYMLMSIPDNVPQEKIDKAVEAGVITLRHGMMMLGKPQPWEGRNGELWVQIGTVDFFDGQGQKPNWEKCLIENGLLTFVTTRYKKAE